MLPIVDKPTIQYIVEEAVASGIEDIIIVTGKGKRAIEDHFDSAFELEHNLLEKGKLSLLEEVRKSSNVDIHYIRQKEALGLGHAVWCARNFIGNEPFAVLLGDDIVVSEVPCLKQLIQQYEKVEQSVLGVKTVSPSETYRYGIIDPLHTDGRLSSVKSMVEKPPLGSAPSNLAIMGRYILTPKIFEYLEEQNVGAGGEIQLTDALQKLNQDQGSVPMTLKVPGLMWGKAGLHSHDTGFCTQNKELRAPVLMAIEEILMKEQMNQILVAGGDSL